MSKSKKIALVIFVIILSILFLAGIYFVIRLLESDTAPDPSRADCNWVCTDNCGCGCTDYFDARPHCCGGNYTRACVPGSEPQGCNVSFPGGVTGCVSISSCSGEGIRFEKFTRDAPQGTTNSDCVGTSTNREVITLGNGTHCPGVGAPCGKCIQYDRLDGDGGVAQYTGDCATSQITCYRCTESLTDGNACESRSFTTSSCPAGWGVNPNCFASLPGGVCPTQTASFCGDGVKDSGEECDPAAIPTGCALGQVCSANCQCSTTPASFCGDGVIDPGESCDPLATPTGCAENQTCSSICTCVTQAFCGDGVVNGTEQCDPGATPTGCQTGQICSQSCLCEIQSLPVCGSNCTSSSDCPANHSCGTLNRCVLNDCLTNPANCTSDGCALLPATAIFNNSKTDLIIFGTVLVLFGIISFSKKLPQKINLRFFNSEARFILIPFNKKIQSEYFGRKIEKKWKKKS